MVINQMARFNGVSLHTEYFDVDIKETEEKEHGLFGTLVQLFEYRTMAVRSCIVFLNW